MSETALAVSVAAKLRDLEAYIWQQWVKLKPGMKVYHGTLASLVPNILRDGLKPRGKSKSHDQYIGWPSRPDMVYLTSSQDIALKHACRISEHTVPAPSIVIFEIDMNLLSEPLLYPDEDYLACKRNSFRCWASEEQADFMERERETWAVSLALHEIVAYKGIVPPEAVHVYPHSEQDEQLARIMLQNRQGRA